MYDGSIFVESSVGDAYPKNIVLRTLDGVNPNDEVDFKT